MVPYVVTCPMYPAGFEFQLDFKHHVSGQIPICVYKNWLCHFKQSSTISVKTYNFIRET